MAAGVSRSSSSSAGSATTPGAKSKLPDLPGNALVLTSADEATWELEKKEYATLAECKERKSSFAPLLASFELQGRFYHAFESQGEALAGADFEAPFRRCDGKGGLVGVAVQDKVRLSLLSDLIEGVVWCHLQGAPHLALDATTVRLYQTPPPPGKRFGLWRMSLVGIGAGPQLVARSAPYQVGNESWAFNPPETLSGALIKGNLPGLYAWDAWGVGTLLAMVCGGGASASEHAGESPFAAEADAFDLTFSTQAAVSKRIKARLGDFGALLSELNEGGNGFLFRHGWVVQLLVGLLKPDPAERMSVIEAREIMTAGTQQPQRGPAASNNKGGQTSRTAGGSPGAASKKGPGSVAPPLSAEEMMRLRETFESFDVDGSGDIDADEVVGAMGKIGVKVTPEQAARVILDADSDGDGKLDFVEFTLLCQDLLQAAKSGADPELSATTVFGRKLSSTEGEPFRSLEAMITIADKGLSEVVIQARPGTPGLATNDLKNYGEVVGFRNRADGDRWDVLIAGLDQQLPEGSRHRLSAVLGVVLIKGGNHKLVVSVGGARPTPEAVRLDVDAFSSAYAATHPNVRSGNRVRFMAFEGATTRGAGTLDVKQLQLSVNDDDDDENDDNASGTGGRGDGDGLGDDDKDSPPPTFISKAF